METRIPGRSTQALTASSSPAADLHGPCHLAVSRCQRRQRDDSGLQVAPTSMVDMTNHAIKAEGLTKHYGDTIALDGIDLAVPEGSVLGVLGPNGAGKTTAVRILATLLQPDA